MKSRPNAGFLLRLGLAVLLLTGSFLTLRFLEHGSCILPVDSEATWAFLALVTLFAIGFVWLVAEWAYRFLVAVGVRRDRALISAIGAALAVYAVPAAIGWFVFSLPLRPGDETAYRATLSVFWIVGILHDSGNFSTYACGQ